ncbi:MAG TPA: pentapeptide repeat-containing protein [Saprospiraceae bacterium]|nr:pentapeptide repeat-containing protein [Saprospiraceae bacterium]HMQ82327.1 pentapeptide repeat-containing protein [Saprospiraceae bacterium]
MEKVKPIKKWIASVWAWMIVSPIRFFLVAIAFFFPLILWLDLSWFKDSDDLKNVLVEAHGLLFDLLVFGVILALYEHYQQQHENVRKAENDRQQRIERYQEEISDFLGWQDKEATNRIVGNIKRLNKEGITSIALGSSYLEGAYLSHANLMNSYLGHAKMNGVYLIGANLKNVYFIGADLKYAALVDAILEGSNLSNADLSYAVLARADFQNVDFKNTKGLTFESLKSCKTLFHAKNLPEDLEKLLKKENPALFKKPEDT